MMLRRFHAQGADERGAALVVTIGITAIITALAVISATVSINNMKNATRDKQANSALATSEAGVAEAIEFLRSGTIGLSQLTCAEPAPAVDPATACPTSATNPANWWTNSQAPKEVAVDGAASCTPGETCYKVWIGTITPYQPPVQTFGIYRIHASGKFGGGPAVRNVVVDVKVKPYPYPIGVYGTNLTGGGSASLQNESLFTQSCVSQRQPDASGSSGLRFAGGVDLQYDMPPAAHTIQQISTESNCGTKNQANGGLASCTVTGYVHPCNPSGATTGCNPNFPYDQSTAGKPESSFSLSSCYKVWTSPTGSGKKYPTTSLFTIQDLQAVGYRPRGLSDAIYDTLKVRAKAAGTYFTSATANPYSALLAQGASQAVVYFEIPSTDSVALGPGNFPSVYFRPVNTSSNCSSPSVTIVVQGGGLKYNSPGSVGDNLVASIFVPDGAYDGQGNINIIGTLFAKEIKLTGTQDFKLDQCFVSNPPSVILDVTVQTFREDDTRDAP